MNYANFSLTRRAGREVGIAGNELGEKAARYSHLAWWRGPSSYDEQHFATTRALSLNTRQIPSIH